MAEGTGAAPAPSTGGLADNVAGLLVYLIGVLAIVFLLIEPYNKNKFVRFHCFQCIFFWVGVIALNIGLMIVSMALGMISSALAAVAGILWLVFPLAYMVAWIMLMVKAYQGQQWKLPVIGNLAEKYA
ncbi:MAG TPA: hypothetical protein VLA96_02740 [Terriglobales bacterium]|nr:hypothetical protein [Terriglobales bacterium]